MLFNLYLGHLLTYICVLRYYLPLLCNASNLVRNGCRADPKMLRGTVLFAVAAMASAIHLGGSPHTGLPAAKIQTVSGQSQPLTRTALQLKPATELEHLRGGATAHAAPAAKAPASPLKLFVLIVGWSVPYILMLPKLSSKRICLRCC